MDSLPYEILNHRVIRTARLIDEMSVGCNLKAPVRPKRNLLFADSETMIPPDVQLPVHVVCGRLAPVTVTGMTLAPYMNPHLTFAGLELDPRDAAGVRILVHP